MKQLIALWGFVPLLGLTAASLPAATRADDTNTDVRAVIDRGVRALGGEARLRALHAIDATGFAYRNELEQSERPSGPYIVDIARFHEQDDLRALRTRIETTTETPNGPDPRTVRVDDDAAAVSSGARSGPGSQDQVDDALDALALGPDRVLLTARDAPDVHAGAPETFGDTVHDVVAFTWRGRAVSVAVNADTGYPEAVDISRARPYDVFWYVWGDVRTRTQFSAWELVDGIRFPTQWTITRDGLPFGGRRFATVAVDGPFPDSTFTVTPSERAAFAARAGRSLEALRVAAASSVAVTPRITLFPGSWNVACYDVGDGLVIVEAPISAGYSRSVIDEIARRFPSRPIIAVVTTSDSWPHIGGIREYAAAGIPIYALDKNRTILERAFAARHTTLPDAYERLRSAPAVTYVSRRLHLGDRALGIELIPYRTQTGERQMMVYQQAAHALYTSDLFALAPDGSMYTTQFFDEARSAITREGLVVDVAFGMHYGPTPWKRLSGAHT